MPRFGATRLALATWSATLAVAIALLLPPAAIPRAESDLLPVRLDRIAHFLLFALLAFVWRLRLDSRGGVRYASGSLWSALFAYGATLEWLQPRLASRSAEWADLLADGLGAACALVGMALAARVSGRPQAEAATEAE